MHDTICAVIVSFNSPDKLNICINSSIHQTHDIVVIDNSSDPAVKERISGFHAQGRVSFIFNDDNRGLAAALNQGLRHSIAGNYRWTLLLDQDSAASEDMLHEMLLSYNKLSTALKEQTAAVVPRIYDRDFDEEFPPIITTGLFNKKISSDSGDQFIHFQITSGTLIKNSAVNTIGCLNENFFIDYIDYDFCFRLLENRLKILFSSKAILYHSLGEKKKIFFFPYREHTPIRVYYQTRNRLSIIRKYGNKHRSVVYAELYRFILKFLKIIFVESGKRDKIKMYLKGVRDFVKG